MAKRLQSVAELAPGTTSAFLLLPVPLKSKTADAADREFKQYLSLHGLGRPWSFATTVNSNGDRFGLASPYLETASKPGSPTWYIVFALSHLITRLSAWYLTTLWRAEELGTATYSALAEWHVLVAAACSRGLLEGAAAFTVATREAINEWDAFKRSGPPSREAISDFEGIFNKRLIGLQYASRIGQHSRKPPPLLSKNVIGYIAKLAKEVDGYNVDDTYDWLCDAVHPSFGSGTTFTQFRGVDHTRTHRIEKLARRPLSIHPETALPVEPTVAQAAADAVIIASTVLLRDLSRVRWLIDDMGFTSKLGLDLRLDYFGRAKVPGPNETCPCRSGKKFKKCYHSWGLSGLPPEELPDGH